MSERTDLLASIAGTIQDYQAGVPPTPEHVDRWIKQFDKTVQLAVLREMDHVLKQTYVSLTNVTEFLKDLLKTKELAGKEPCTFWRGVNFLNIQSRGNSQTEMLELFDAILKERCGFGIEECDGKSAVYLYLDDGIFTGNRVRHDLEAWIAEDAPAEAKIHIVTIALHSNGYYYANEKIKKAARNAEKSIDFIWGRAIELEDQKVNTNSSDVLRPVSIPDEDPVREYVKAMNRQPYLRTAGQVGANDIFSSDKGRQLLEQEFLKAGVRIRNMCPNLNEYQRPLGNSILETLGFGSLIVTFRNCPNNTPLALWVGEPWYPLFPRTTNSQTEIRRLFADLPKDEDR